MKWLDQSDLVSISQEAQRLRASGRDPVTKLAEIEIGFWVWYFSTPKRNLYQNFLERMGRYKTMISKKLKTAGIPQEFIYLSMIESGFNNSAVSHAGAGGLWQFMPATATRYGLKIEKGIDERFHPEKATNAAIAYLIDLYNVFQSWPLVASAYNAGEGRIVRAIMASKTRRYWEINQQGILPKETSQYVGKWFAATTIGKNPEKYGFKQESIVIPESIVQVSLPSPISFARLAKRCQLAKPLLVKLNPHLAIGWYQTTDASTTIRIPAKRLAACQGKAKLLSEN